MAPWLTVVGTLPSLSRQLGMSLPPPPALPSAFLTHVTLVLPAVLPLLVGIAHTAVAVDMDVTWGSEGRVRSGDAGKGRGWHPVPHHHPPG